MLLAFPTRSTGRHLFRAAEISKDIAESSALTLQARERQPCGDVHIGAAHALLDSSPSDAKTMKCAAPPRHSNTEDFP
jgi:hypothetical protein